MYDHARYDIDSQCIYDLFEQYLTENKIFWNDSSDFIINILADREKCETPFTLCERYLDKPEYVKQSRI